MVILLEAFQLLQHICSHDESLHGSLDFAAAVFIYVNTPDTSRSLPATRHRRTEQEGATSTADSLAQRRWRATSFRMIILPIS